MKKSTQKIEKILIWPDTHYPYEDKKAVELVLQVGRSLKPDHVIILGDFADFYAVSSHSKNPERATQLDKEVEAVKEALDKVKALGAKNNVFVSGNHENRLERYLQDKAPELFKLLTIPGILELKKKGFTYVPYRESYTLGKMHFTHDTGTAGRHAHYKSMDSFQSNIVIGHTHRVGYTVEGSALGEKHVAAMFGWLGDKEAVDYMHKVKIAREWSLGFGVGYLDPKNGHVHLSPIPIVEDKKAYTCVVEGKIYRQE
jgi:predicted phosphodiesterase